MTFQDIPYIDIEVKTCPEEVIIKICDNGLGITEKSINNIFDLYYRTNNGNIPGNGLGLYIVKNIVEDLNGEIAVASDLKNGTCFEISLPNSNQLIMRMFKKQRSKDLVLVL